MAEVVGLIASAAQLAQYSIKISCLVHEINKRVHGANRLQEYDAQIRQLLETTLQIRQSDGAHSNAVGQQINSCRAEAEDLHLLLEQVLADYTIGSLGRRYCKAVTGIRESNIAEGFKKLERAKTSLIVSISISNTEKLASIQEGVTRLVHKPLEPSAMACTPYGMTYSPVYERGSLPVWN